MPTQVYSSSKNITLSIPRQGYQARALILVTVEWAQSEVDQQTIAVGVHWDAVGSQGYGVDHRDMGRES